MIYLDQLKASEGAETVEYYKKDCPGLTEDSYSASEKRETGAPSKSKQHHKNNQKPSTYKECNHVE